ncbi:MAG: hypothetical protein HKN23_08985 [Verrucomicrobiales bacterium]|nr:hypothetical protein [Verrucomicrobiales bacterium]
MSEPDEPKFKAGTALLKTFIAILPALLAFFIATVVDTSRGGDIWFSICLALIGIGSLLAGGLVVQGIRKHSKRVHVAVLILIFLAVAAAYASIGIFGGCWLIVIVSGM